MAKPGRPPKTQKEPEQKSTGTPEAPAQAEPKPISAEAQNTTVANRCEKETWMYHPEQEPRIFKVGEIIPEGWEPPTGPARKLWTPNALGKWVRKS